MEQEQYIEWLIRERGLRNMLEKEEKRLSEARRVHRSRLFFGTAGFIAAAAILTLVLSIVPTAREMQAYSIQYVKQIESGAYRGADEMTDMLSEAMDKMKTDHWADAEQIADALLARTGDTEDEYKSNIRQSAEWIKALCLMHDKKYFAARKMLIHIVESDSYYSPLAEEILKKK